MDAVAELNEMMAKEAWTADEIRRMGDVFAQLRDPANRLRQFLGEQLRATPQPTGAAAVKVGVCLYLLGRFSDAAATLAAGTDNKERRYYQGLAHKQLRQYDKALENLQFAQDRGWDAREVGIERAEIQCLSGDLDAAAKTVQSAGRIDDEPDWQYVAGLLAEMRGDYEQAVARYEQARQLRPGHVPASFRLAYFYDLHGDEEMAIELYRQCVTRMGQPGTGIARTPLYANALMNLAVLYEDFGHYEDSARCLQRVLAANPTHLRARLFFKDVQASKTMMFDEDEAKRAVRRNDLLMIPVTDFELSVRARNCLKKMNIRTLGDLLHVTEPELLSYKNFGETSLTEIRIMLASKSLRLGQLREEKLEEIQPPPLEPAEPVGNEGVLATPIAQVEFSVRARKALERLNVRTLGELAAKTEAELLAVRNFGQTSLNEIQQRLGEYGLRLREGP